MFPSPSSRDQLQELFCAAVEQQVFGPEPQRCFGFWGGSGSLPKTQGSGLAHSPQGSSAHGPGPYLCEPVSWHPLICGLCHFQGLLE